MSLLRHVLVPYDFSTAARQIVPFVHTLAVRFNARITLFSVVPPAHAAMSPDMSTLWLRDGLDAAAWRHNLQTQLDGALVDELAGLPVDRVTASGDPALRIADFAHARDVDLIMMPTHGVGTFRSLLVGSVTSKVLHDARCPVWTAVHATTQAAAALPRTILCAIDESEEAAAVVKWASAFACATGSILRVLHVVEPVSDWLSLASERRLQEQAREESRARIQTVLNDGRVAADLRVAVGGIVETTAEVAKQDRADLLIVGRGALSEPFARLRTHAFGMIQRSPCPVLSV
jgi:nucleotide-binding universal stress UspA family protein